MALGPVIGGLLVTSVGWRSIFWINIPIGLAAAVLALRYVPESKAPAPRKVDIPGQMLVIMFLASLTYGIIEAPDQGWSSILIVGTLAVAAVSLAAFLIWEHRTSDPLVDLRFFRSVPFSSATVSAAAAFAALGGFLFLNTLYLQDVRGLSPLHAGLDTLPMAAMTALFPPISGRIVSRRGARIPLVMAGLALFTACLMLVGLGATTPFTWLFTAYVIFGIGYGFVNAPITNAAVSGMPRAQAGVAAAIATTSRQIGSTLGVAVVGSLVATSLRKAEHLDFALASRAGWWVLAGCGALVLILGLVATSAWANDTARRTAESINPEFLEGNAA
jgi:EmrB/QacA subfamily drug resistance transporter